MVTSQKTRLFRFSRPAFFKNGHFKNVQNRFAQFQKIEFSSFSAFYNIREITLILELYVNGVWCAFNRHRALFGYHRVHLNISSVPAKHRHSHRH